MNFNLLKSQENTVPQGKHNEVTLSVVGGEKERLINPNIKHSPDFENPHISVRNLNVHIQKNHILKNVNLDIPNRAITCIIGPSG